MAALGIWLSRRGMGHTSQNCRNIRPCRVSLVCCFLLLGGGGGGVGFGGVLFWFFWRNNLYLSELLEHTAARQPNLQSPLGSKGQIWLSLQMGKSNHSLVATVKVWHRIKSIFWMVHHAQLAMYKIKKKQETFVQNKQYPCHRVSQLQR